VIRTAQNGPVTVLTLDRAERRNALTPEMLDQLIAAIPAAAANSNAIVLAGAGKVFCAGFDLSLCKDDTTGAVMRSLLTGLSLAIRALRAAPVPVIIAAHGAAIAGGCALLGGGDVVITNDNASIGYPVTRMGISPAVSAPFLRQAVGDGACRERMLDSGLITGREALCLGLAHECLADPVSVGVRADALASELAAKPKNALAATKAWLHELSPTSISATDALAVSIGLAGGREERELLERFWSRSDRP